MGPVVTDGSTVTVILSSPYAGITRSGSYGRRPRAVLSAHRVCAPALLARILLRPLHGPHRHRGVLLRFPASAAGRRRTVCSISRSRRGDARPIRSGLIGRQAVLSV